MGSRGCDGLDDEAETTGRQRRVLHKDKLEASFLELLKIFNGNWRDDRPVHYCTGASCCPGGRIETIHKASRSIRKVILGKMPCIPAVRVRSTSS